MTSYTLKNTKNSWTEVKSSTKFDGFNFIDSIVYSPDSRYGITVELQFGQFSCRLVDMTNGEIKKYNIEQDEIEDHTYLVVYYFVNPQQFVVVTFDGSVGQYNQQMYTINVEKEEVIQTGRPILLCIDSSGMVQAEIEMSEIRGCDALVVKGKRFLVLPACDGLLLTPWNPLCWNSETDKSIYLSIPLDELRFRDCMFSNEVQNFHCFGSKVFFIIRTETSLFVPGNDGEDEEVMREHFDRFIALDLAGLDLDKRFMVLNDVFSKLQIVDLEKTSDGIYNTLNEYQWSQDGQYLIAEESRKITSLAYKRPATKKRIYVIDLENMTTSLVWAKVRLNCTPTIYNGSLHIWRTRMPVERRIKLKNSRMEVDVYSSTENIYEFKTISIPNRKVSSLLFLTKNYFILGRNDVPLSSTYITRFIET